MERLAQRRGGRNGFFEIKKVSEIPFCARNCVTWVGDNTSAGNHSSTPCVWHLTGCPGVDAQPNLSHILACELEGDAVRAGVTPCFSRHIDSRCERLQKDLPATAR